MFPELRRPRSEPSSYYSSETQKDYPAPKKHKLSPEYFQARQEKLLSTALSLEQPSVRKQNSSSKQSATETISPSEGIRDYGQELSQHIPEVAGYRGSGSQAGIKWNPKDIYIGVSAVQVTGSQKGTALGKDTVAHRLRQREQMNVLMMADREMVDAELLSYRDNVGDEDCLPHMDDLQVNIIIAPRLSSVRQLSVSLFCSATCLGCAEERDCEKFSWKLLALSKLREGL